MRPDVVDELIEPELDRVDQIGEELDRIVENQLDGLFALLDETHDSRFEFLERLDDFGERIEEARGEAFVLLLNLLEALVCLVVRFLVFLRELLGEIVLLVVDALLELLEAAGHFLRGGLAEGDVLGDVDGAAGLVEGGRLAGRQPHLEAERRGGRRVRLGQGEGAAGDGRRAGRQLQAVQRSAAGQGE